MPDRNRLKTIVTMMGKGQFNRVISACNDLLTLEPENAVAQNLLGTALAESGDSEGGIAVLRALVLANPDYAFAHHNLGNVLVKNNDPQAAIAAFQTAADLLPDNGEIQNSLASAFAAADDPHQALHAARAAVALAPDDMPKQKRLITYLRQIGDHEAALKELNAALALEPWDPELLIASGALMIQTDTVEAALERFQRAAKVNPDSPELYSNVGRLWLLHEQYEKACEAFQRATALSPENPKAHNRLAEALLQSGDHQGAIAAYAACLKIDPSDGHARHFMAVLSGDTPASAPEDYVRGLFDEYAETFEQSLVQNLGYRVPDTIAARLSAALPERPRFKSLLDLGCGTGLMGEKIRSRVDHLSGVDLSENMVRIANGKQVYDQLNVSDLSTQIAADGDRHDIYIAADVLIYVGELSGVFAAIRESARPGAIFAFTTEDHIGEGITLRASGRYAHSASYIKDICSQNSMEILDHQTVDMRQEKGEMLRGGCFIVQTAAGEPR